MAGLTDRDASKTTTTPTQDSNKKYNKQCQSNANQKTFSGFKEFQTNIPPLSLPSININPAPAFFYK